LIHNPEFPIGQVNPPQLNPDDIREHIQIVKEQYVDDPLISLCAVRATPLICTVIVQGFNYLLESAPSSQIAP